ncbi:hypothetical protein H8E07_04880 [bacterium]|nr:hypothetical protein [bacterium]
MTNHCKSLLMTSHTIRLGLALLLVLLLPLSSRSETFVADNGLTVNVHAGAALEDYLVEDGGKLVLRHPATGDVELFRGPDDPRFTRPDVNEFRPLPVEAVEAALREVHTLRMGIEVDVFILPAAPVVTACSFARRNAILLAPSFGAVDESTVGSITVHELGHVLTWGYFDKHPERWETYMRLRGLNRTDNGPSAPHAQRAREILAEDIRYLFGGRTANVYHSIENAELLRPDSVEGLIDFLIDSLEGAPVVLGGAVCTAFPNPCNPRTTIELSLPGDETLRNAATARLELYDTRGRRVRVVEGGTLGNGRLLIVWDGRADDGTSLPSGRYLYMAGWRGLRGRGVITLVK